MGKADRLVYRDALLAAMERYRGLAYAHGNTSKLFYRRFMDRAEKVRRLLERDFSDLHLIAPAGGGKKQSRRRRNPAKPSRKNIASVRAAIGPNDLAGQ
jgi:hypothetical protein